MAQKAVTAALKDAGLEYTQIQQAYVGYVYGDTVNGQRALYPLGQSGIPIFNVTNACATGSSALFLARQAVASGAADVVLAVGFEQMRRGALAAQWDDRPNPLGPLQEVTTAIRGWDDSVPFAAQYFGGAGEEYARRHDLTADTFARVAVKARRHAASNPYAVFRDPLTVEEILASPRIYGPLTRLQCCPPTCGAAAAVVCSEAFAQRHGLARGVVIRAQAMTTDTSSTFNDEDMTKVVGYDATASAARQVYESAGVDPREVAVVELHDCFTTNEVISYEALGLVEEGGAEKFIVDGENTYGGRVVTNPSGGLLSKGHPLGATGLAQCAELVWQLRGEAGARQVEGARLGLQHNIGLGGACVVTLYEAVN
jgi:acetyl-CoA acyltransferase